MKILLAYGETGLAVDFPEDRTTVLEPLHAEGLPDERAAVAAALRAPTAAQPLADLARKATRACVVFTDITRATPNDRLIPWVLDELRGLPREAVTLLNSTGSHRPNTPAELEKMLGREIVRGWRVLNHESEKDADLVQIGVTRNGAPKSISTAPCRTPRSAPSISSPAATSPPPCATRSAAPAPQPASPSSPRAR